MCAFSSTVLSLVQLCGILTRNGGSSSTTDSDDSSAISHNYAAAPANVLDALRASLAADGFDLVSRSDSGDYYRQVVPAHAMAQDEETEHLARFGDMILTARVHMDGAEVRTGFAQLSVAASYRIAVAPGADGKGSVVTMTPELEQGSDHEGRRIAARLRTSLDRHAGIMLDRIVGAAGG